MIKYYLALLVSMTCYHSTANDLLKYYNGDIKLSTLEIDSIADGIIADGSDYYLIALAYYQKGIILRNENQNFEAYHHYDQALVFLQKADTTDTYLLSAILRNQGVILKQYGLTSFAIEKYKQALEPAFKYSLKRGLSVKYNLGRAMMYENPEEALKIFMEELDEAKKEGFKDRMAKVYYEIGQLFLYAQEYPKSIEQFEKAVATAESGEVKLRSLHNLSRPYDHMGRFHEQKEILLRALSMDVEGELRFTSLMDLGECLIELDQKDSAVLVLKEAEKYYADQPLTNDNVKVYKWLSLASENDFAYAWKWGSELQKIIDTKEKLEILLKQQAMLQLYLRLESERLAKKTINAYQILAITGGVFALLILLTWRIWWFSLRKQLGKKIMTLVSRWEEEDKE